MTLQVALPMSYLHEAATSGGRPAQTVAQTMMASERPEFCGSASAAMKFGTFGDVLDATINSIRWSSSTPLPHDGVGI